MSKRDAAEKKHDIQDILYFSRTSLGRRSNVSRAVAFLGGLVFSTLDTEWHETRFMAHSYAGQRIKRVSRLTENSREGCSNRARNADEIALYKPLFARSKKNYLKRRGAGAVSFTAREGVE